MKNLKEYFANILVTVLAFAVIFYFFDLEKIIEITVNSDYYLIFAAIIVYFIVVSLMVARIKIILDKLKYHPPILSIMESNLAGMLASDFTPARSGYFFTAFSLSSKHKIPINDSVLTIFGPQLLDFSIKAISLVLMFVLILNNFGMLNENLVLTILSIACIFLAIGFFGALIFAKGFIEKFSFIKKLPFGNKIYSLFDLMQKKSYKLMDIKWKIILITICSWLTKAFEWFLVARALNIFIFDGGVLDYLFIIIVHGSVTLIHFIPLPTIAGSGASEIGFSGILYLFGVPLETGITFAIITRLVMIIVDVFGIWEILRYVRKEGIAGILKEIDSLDRRKE